MLTFFLSPIGRYLAIGLAAVAVFSGAYVKGRFDGRSAYKAKIERQIQDAVTKGNDARGNALRELDAGRVPDDWFRD
ncbi:MAG: hypothetical protein KIT48_09350 [Pseudolabrys sp.]|nr:hypothetical protein [Pseudolabrys sp.]